MRKDKTHVAILEARDVLGSTGAYEGTDFIAGRKDASRGPSEANWKPNLRMHLPAPISRSSEGKVRIHFNSGPKML